VLSLGVLAELWLEFPEFGVVGPTDLARVPLEMYPLLHYLGWSVFLGIYQAGLDFFMGIYFETCMSKNTPT
jgi:hypothetical protein